MRLIRLDTVWHGYSMCPSARMFWMVAMLSVSSATVTLAQTGSVLAPVAPPRDQPAHPPAAAPRTPVRDMGSAKVPVVPPHGSNHPEKPILATPPKPPATPPPAAAPVAPAQPSTDVPPAQAEKLPDPEKPASIKPRLPMSAVLHQDQYNPGNFQASCRIFVD